MKIKALLAAAVAVAAFLGPANAKPSAVSSHTFQPIATSGELRLILSGPRFQYDALGNANNYRQYAVRAGA